MYWARAAGSGKCVAEIVRSYPLDWNGATAKPKADDSRMAVHVQRYKHDAEMMALFRT